jgi:hypothetical protein
MKFFASTSSLTATNITHNDVKRNTTEEEKGKARAMIKPKYTGVIWGACTGLPQREHRRSRRRG